MIPDDFRSALLALPAGTVVHARVSWLRSVVSRAAVPYLPASIHSGNLVARLGCGAGPCVELWAVDDAAIAADWEVQP